jgi:hypothetical protein
MPTFKMRTYIQLLLLATLATNCGDSPTEPTPLPRSLAITGCRVPGQLQCRAIVEQSDGGLREVTSEARWSTSEPSIATINQFGLVSPLKPGRTDVVAQFGTLDARVTLEVQTGE